MNRPPSTPEYDSGFVQSLFDEMSSTYGVMNTVTSFGFSERWRCRAVKALELQHGAAICDLMCGMGESWKYIRHHHPDSGALTGADFSGAMCEGARKNAGRHPTPVRIHQTDVLAEAWPEAPVDAVVCTFGIKTLDRNGMKTLGEQLGMILKPGGQFSFVEISVPAVPGLRVPYLFYLNHVIPWLGRLFLGNPDNYRCLGQYTRAFQNARAFADILEDLGYTVAYRNLFFGCASLVTGHIPGDHQGEKSKLDKKTEDT